MYKKIYRSRTDKVIGGVCGGLGKYFEIDPVLIRVIFVLLGFFHGSGLIIYLILLIVIPQEPLQLEYENIETDNSQKTSEENPINSTSQAKDRTKQIFGIILLIVGSILLLQNLIPLFDFEIILPIILILIGIYILYRAKN